MNRTLLPNLISKDYLETVKARLDNKTKYKPINIIDFCKTNTLLLLSLLLIILICVWRYKLKKNGDLNNTPKKITEIKKKAAISEKQFLEKVKKENNNINKNKFAKGNSEKKITKLKNLPKQQFKPENNVTILPNLQAANTTFSVGALY
jgi:hypothetical protein